MKTLIEILAIPFAIGYAVVTYFQWQDLRQNFVTDERAWVRPQLAWTAARRFAERGDDYLPGEMFDGNVTLRLNNTGKSPILKIESQTWLEILNENAAPYFTLNTPRIITLGTFIFPGQPGDSTVHRMDANNKFNDPTEQELESVREGSAYVIVYGTVAYYDTFGAHWIRWCQMWHNIDPVVTAKHPSYKAGTCWDFNASGDGDNGYFVSTDQIREDQKQHPQ